MKPSETGSLSLRSGSPRSGREAVPGQLDLFAERGAVTPRHTQNPLSSTSATPVERLTDDELLERIPNAGPSDVDGVCTEVVSRSLDAAVPALEALWRRFVGFGIEKPLAEQRAVMDTLARLRCADAHSALRRIVLSRALPASQLRAALQAAAQARLALPAAFVGSFLTHADAALRGAAFALTAKSNVAADRLREGLLDPSAENRRLATIALGLRGDPGARRPLYDELMRLPSADVIEAITAVWDEDAIVHLGRCARRQPRLAGAVLDALREIGTSRAETVARRLESSAGTSIPTGKLTHPEG